MRWNFVARLARFAGGLGLHHPVQFPNLGLQQINLLLLAKNSPVQFLDMVLGETEFDFEFGNSGFHADSPGRR